MAGVRDGVRIALVHSAEKAFPVGNTPSLTEPNYPTHRTRANDRHRDRASCVRSLLGDVDCGVEGAWKGSVSVKWYERKGGRDGDKRRRLGGYRKGRGIAKLTNRPQRREEAHDEGEAGGPAVH